MNRKYIFLSLIFIFVIYLIFPHSGNAIDPFANKYLIKGKNFFNNENFKKSFWYFYISSSIDRDEPVPWYYLGITLYELKDYKNAYSSLSWAKYNHIDRIYWHDINRLMAKCKNNILKTKLNSTMKKLAKLQPNLWQAYKFMNEGEYKLAASLLEPAYKILPLDFEISVSLAISLLKIGNVKSAYKPVKTAFHLSPTMFKETLRNYDLPARRIIRKLNKINREKNYLRNFFENMK